MKKLFLITALVFMSSQAMADEFTANELCKTFSDNGDAADQQYKNKRIIVSGRIARIGRASNYWKLRLSCDSRSGMNGIALKVFTSASSQLMILEKAKNDYLNSSSSIAYDWKKKHNHGKNTKFSCEYQRYTKAGVYLKNCSIN